MIRRGGLALLMGLLAGRGSAAVELATTLKLPSSSPEMRDSFEIVAEVLNTAAYTPGPLDNATNVTPQLAINSDDGAIAFWVSGPTPATVASLEGGALGKFTWVYQAAQPGTLNITVTVNGQSISGPILNEERIASGTLFLSDAALYATVYVTPGAVGRGRDVLVTAVVGNYGVNTAGLLAPLSYTASGCAIPSEITVTSPDAGSVVEVAGPYPDCSLNLDPGSEVTFSWTFTAYDAGTVNFTVDFTATGNGIPTSLVRAQDTATLYIRDLCASAFVVPGRLTVGQNVTLLGQVTVCGPDAENGIVPLSYTATGCGLPSEVGVNSVGGGNVLPVSGPSPNCPVSLPSGGQAKFTWVFGTTQTGLVDFTVSFTGLGLGQAPYPRAQATVRLEIQAPPQLSVTVWSDPVRSVPYQQDVGIYMRVTNAGEADADLVEPLPQTETGTGALFALDCAPYGPCPVSGSYNVVEIPGGGGFADFTWRYRAEESGYVVVSSAAAGVDFNTRQPLVSPAVLLPLIIPRPEALSLTITGAAGLIRGQEFTLGVSAVNPSSVTSLCQAELGDGGFRAYLNGSPEHLTILEVSPPIPRCYERCVDCPPDALVNCCQREFTLRVRVGEGAPLGPGQLFLEASGTDGAGVRIVSSGNTLPVTVWSNEPGIVSASPNPLRLSRAGSVSIKFVVAPEQAGAPVTLRIYTIAGELLRTLVDETLAPGLHEVEWNGRNAGGKTVASGIYILLLQGRLGQDVAKLAVIK